MELRYDHGGSMPREKPPCRPLNGEHKVITQHAFRVWAYSPPYAEDPKPWKCVALFYYLSDCLDYIASMQDKGVNVVFQSPADCRHITADDARVVYKAAVPA